VSEREQSLRREGVIVEITDSTRSGPSAIAVADLAAHVLCAEGAAHAEVGVAFVGERRIRRLNHEHRGVDGVTDVLSFPLEEAGEWDDGAGRRAESGDAAGERTGPDDEAGPQRTDADDDSWQDGGSPDAAGEPPRLLGDVVICVRQAARQAAADGTPRSFELAVLLVHGLLHLLGWEHDERPGPMALRQAELLTDFDWSTLG
jgi:probable rRNA maturation factor